MPALSKTGEPINTPEVQFARKQHLVAVEVAKERQEKAKIEEQFEPIKYEEVVPYEQHVEYEGGYEYEQQGKYWLRHCTE